MFERIKNLFAREEPPSSLEIGELPGIIADEEARVRRDLDERTGNSRKMIERVRSEMLQVLGTFDSESMEEVSHRKLAGVTERSFPLFQKAMKMSISRDLPDDTEGFYTVTGEILKGCLSAFRGQGRYLAARFPTEMKVLRDGMDAMGREANAMTAEISRARERRRRLAALHEALEDYQSARAKVATLGDEIQSLEEGIRVATDSLVQVKQAISNLEGSEEYAACQEDLRRIRRLSADRDEAARLFGAAASTAGHLMRKGEKLAERKRDREAARILGQAVVLLDREPPLPDDANPLMFQHAVAALTTLASSGDLVPKNREEMEILEDPEGYLQRMANLSRKVRAVSSEMASAEAALRAAPILVKYRELHGEADRMEREIPAGQERLKRARAEARDLEEKMPGSLDAIRQEAEGILGKLTRIRDPEAGSSSGEVSSDSGDTDP